NQLIFKILLSSKDFQKKQERLHHSITFVRSGYSVILLQQTIFHQLVQLQWICLQESICRKKGYHQETLTPMDPAEETMKLCCVERVLVFVYVTFMLVAQSVA